MEVVKIFTEGEKKYDINIRGELDCLLFKAKDIVKVLDIKNISMALKPIDNKEKFTLIDSSNKGVRNVAYLSQNGVYELIFNSRKEKAKLFRSWIINIIIELSTTKKYIIDDKLNVENPNIFDKAVAIDAEKKGRHYTLIEYFKNKNVVYICEIKNTINGKKLIKIGETSNIANRIQGIKCELGVPVYIIKIYEVLRNHDMEQFIFRNPLFIENKFNGTMSNGHQSKEMFCLSCSFTIDKIDKYILGLIETFNKPLEETIENENFLFEKERLQIDKKITDQKDKELKLREQELQIYAKHLEVIEKKGEEINYKLIEQIKERIKKNCIENKEENSPISNLFFVKEHKSRGPYIQKYSSNLKLIEHYESIISVSRKVNGTSSSGLKTAIKNNTIYKGFRWWAIPRNEDPTTEKHIPQTREILTHNKDFIALINLDKTEILNVFVEQKEFAQTFHLSNSAVCSAIKRGSRTQGGYIMFYHKVDEKLREEYELYHDLPEISSDKKNAKKINQINPISGEIIKTFNSINDVILEIQCSRTSLMETIENNKPFKNFKWSFA